MENVPAKVNEDQSDKKARDVGSATAMPLFFSQGTLYALAACLMVLGVSQAWRMLSLKTQLQSANTELAQLRSSDALMNLRLTALEAKDATYATSTVIVAWDSYRHSGVLSMQNLPVPPPGHDYQLWVLDPEAETPISAGLLTPSDAPHPFAVHPLTTPTPGFAISLEPAGGGIKPTGPILFAVAPSQ